MIYKLKEKQNEVRELIRRDSQGEVIHILREGNFCADYLAKFGARQSW